MENFSRIIDFLDQIDLQVTLQPVQGRTFLPGILAERGVLLVDQDKLRHPGDLLHEAGHLALMAPRFRRKASGDYGDDGFEMGAIAWSYAACRHLDLPLTCLFHDQGYKGDAAWLRETFEQGTYIGLPLLEWKQLTQAHGSPAYPEMQRWLCAR